MHPIVGCNLQLARPLHHIQIPKIGMMKGNSPTWKAEVGESRFKTGLIEKPLQCALWV